MNWRRLAATTAAGLLCIHACRVYDDADLEGSSEDIISTGGRRATDSGGGAPPFTGSPNGGTSQGGFSSGGAAASGAGGRGGSSAPSGGGTAGKAGPPADAGEPGVGGDPGDAGAGGEVGAGEAGSDGAGGTVSGGAPSAGGTLAGGTGGITATGGVPTGGGSTLLEPEVIDDCEHVNNRIPRNQDRNGYWSTFDAGTGCTLEPKSSTPNSFMSETEDGSGTGKYALHFVASGGTDGCGVNLEFLSPKEPYDAARYDYVGISFGGRSVAGELDLVIKVAVAATDPSFGVCETCYDHFATSVTLTEAWEEHVVLFEHLAQEGWGSDAGAFDASEIVAIQWLAIPGAANIWIDDVKFVSE